MHLTKIWLLIILAGTLVQSCNREAARAMATAPATPPVERATDPLEPTTEKPRAIDKQTAMAPKDGGAAAAPELPDPAELKERRRREVREKMAKKGQSQSQSQGEAYGRPSRSPASSPAAPAPAYQSRKSSYRLETAPVTQLLTYKKGNCFGDCASYTLALTSDRKMEVDLSKGPREKGNYDGRASILDYRDINLMVDTLRAMDLEELYPVKGDIPADLSARILELPDEKGNLRKVTVYYDAPEILERLIEKLEKLVSVSLPSLSFQVPKG